MRKFFSKYGELINLFILAVLYIGAAKSLANLIQFFSEDLSLWAVYPSAFLIIGILTGIIKICVPRIPG